MPLQDVHDTTAWLELALRPGVSPFAQRSLLRKFGSPHAAVRASAPEVAQACGAAAANAFAQGPRMAVVEATLRWLEHPRHWLVALGAEAYPPLLLHIGDPPNLLFVCGRVELLRSRSLAMVGSRNATPRGAQDAQRLAEQLSHHGYCIVSGLALGIDAAAHRGALRGKSSSVAVMGTGVDVLYPPPNRELALQLAQEGCLVSEFPLGTPPAAGNFPRRNRLISGLARGVVVVEAARNSGSLITARSAAHQGRDVFAVPGSIHSALSKGCHDLIKEGAKLVEDVDDVLEEYNLAHARRGPAVSEQPAEEAHPLLRAMGFAPVGVDELAGLTGMAARDIAAQLARLEIDGRVSPVPGGRFQRRASIAASRPDPAL